MYGAVSPTFRSCSVFESTDVFVALLSDEESPQLRHIGFNRQLVQRLGIVALHLHSERLRLQCPQNCLVPCVYRHADLAGKDCRYRADWRN